MTTILLTKNLIVWDSQITHGSQPKKAAQPKVFTVADVIFAGAGDYPASRDASTWWLNGCDPKKAPKGSWEMIVWKKGYKPILYDSHNQNYTGINVSLPHALGSGGGAAMAALHAGLDPEAAMEIAYKMDVYSSRPTRKLDVREFFKNAKRSKPKSGAEREGN